MLRSTGAALFAEVFAGKPDAWGYSGAKPYAVKEHVTAQTWLQHLYGWNPMGIYCLNNHTGMVKWGCSDIDIDDISIAQNLIAALKELGLVPYLERSRSKGWHVWLFAQDWVPAEHMRNVFLLAHQNAGIPPVEVNPKQTNATTGGYGNFVRLPYINGLNETRQRQVMYDDSGTEPVSLCRWLNALKRIPGTVLADVASRYEPPPQKRIVVPTARLNPAMDGDALKARAPLAWKAWFEGPDESHDRSDSLVRLVRLLEAGGLTPQEAWPFLCEADARWGKQFIDTRKNGMELLQNILRRGYS